MATRRTVTLGRRRASQYAVPEIVLAGDRYRAVLTAAGVTPQGTPFLTSYEMSHEATLTERAFYERALDAGYREMSGGSWPSEAELEDDGDVLIRDADAGVYALPGGVLAYVKVGYGWCSVRVAASKREHVVAAIGAFQKRYPPLYHQAGEDETNMVPITFWTYGRFGPQSRLRLVESATWESVERNYPDKVQEELGWLMSGCFEVGKSGQLMLWQGPPGTGKTWALRALASEWAPWAEFNYITDPDAFFVDAPDYLIDVLLHDSYEEIMPTDTGDELVTAAKEGKWRVLILEDTGELLSSDAKAKSGQGLSRLLNVVDGLIGQGLRILVLVTTNDELGDLHPAVSRPGRCASQIEFGPMSAAEAAVWLGVEDAEPGTLAELYARSGDLGEPAVPEDLDSVVALAREPLPPDPVTASAVVEPVVVEEAVDRLVAAGAPADRAVLIAAIEATAEAHRSTVEAIAQHVAIAPSGQAEDQSAVIATLINAITQFAMKAPPAAPDVHVHVPEQNLRVNVEGTTVEPHVHMPEQPAPVVNVQPGETRVDVHVPPAEAVPIHVHVPEPIHVHVPEQQPVKAPDVHVHVPPAAPTPPRIVRATVNEEGERIFVSEDATPDDVE